MDRTQFLKKLDVLLPRVAASLRVESERLYDSGGVAPADYEDDYLLPKIILEVALSREATVWGPREPANRKAVAILRHF